MIATLTGTLADRSGETIVIQTAAGVGYAVTVPLGVLERLPPAGSRCSLFTELVVREDGWTLYGFDRATDRGIFQRLLTASGLHAWPGPWLSCPTTSAGRWRCGTCRRFPWPTPPPGWAAAARPSPGWSFAG